MFKLRQTLTTLILIALAFFTSCGDDALKEEFSYGDKLSLSKAKLYLANEDTYNGHLYRDYFITDGTYTNNGGYYGWDISDYDNATYYFGIEIGVPEANDLGPGSFPQLDNWGNVGANDNVSYLYFEYPADGTDYYEVYTDSGTEDNSPVVVSGGIEDGKTMTIKFKGKLMHYYHNGTGWVEETEDVRLAIQQKVIDVRDINPPVK